MKRMTLETITVSLPLQDVEANLLDVPNESIRGLETLVRNVVKPTPSEVTLHTYNKAVIYLTFEFFENDLEWDSPWEGGPSIEEKLTYIKDQSEKIVDAVAVALRLFQSSRGE